MSFSDDLSELALFRIGSDLYGIPIEDVQEINRVPELTVVPGADACVKGVMNLRGEIVTVLDLPQQLGYGDSDHGESARVLVVKCDHEHVGVLVDEMKDIVLVEPGAMEFCAVSRDGVDDAFFAGVYTHDSSLVIVLDMSKVLQVEEAAGPIN